MSLRNVGFACFLPALLLAPAAMAETCGTADFKGDTGALRLRRPVTGAVVAGFGMQEHPLLRIPRQHTGVDIAGPMGEPVVAAASGRVEFAGPKDEYGNAITIDHGNGLVTVYAQLSRFAAGIKGEGACVEAGSVIAFIGSTGLSSGPRLHFEVVVDGKRVDPAPVIGTTQP